MISRKKYLKLYLVSGILCFIAAIGAFTFFLLEKDSIRTVFAIVACVFVVCGIVQVVLYFYTTRNMLRSIPKKANENAVEIPAQETFPRE